MLYSVSINHVEAYRGNDAGEALQVISTAIYDNDSVTNVVLTPDCESDLEQARRRGR